MVIHSVVAMVSMAFGIVGIIACLCCKNVDYKMNNKVSLALNSPNLALYGQLLIA